MSIKVYTYPLSAPGRKVLLTLAEKGLDYEFVLIDLTTRQHKQEPYISIINPFGQVPAFEDGDLKLFESRAITEYIAEAYADKGTPLLSKDPKKKAIISLWLEVESLKFDVVAKKINLEIFVRPSRGLPSNEALVEKLIPQLASVLDVYETRLAESKYLAGDSYTLADLHHLPVISNLFKTKIKALFDERPHVSAWCVHILARPAWKKVLADLEM